MNSNFIHIDKNKLEILFPFYFIFDDKLKICSYGKSIYKILPQIKDAKFDAVFSLNRPSRIHDLIESLPEIQDQVVILETKSNKELLFRGQFLRFEKEGRNLFIGSPWLIEVEDLQKHNLTIKDFAIHNTITDMMQIIKSKEMVMDDIKELVNSLKQQKLDLNKATNRLSSLIQNLQSAVLLEDENRKIVLVNEAFCKLFQIPLSPDLLIGADCHDSAEQSKDLFVKPTEFVTRIEAILRNKELVTNELLYLKNGTILQRDFIPIKTNREYSGHLWQYQDVTEQKNNDLQLKQNEEKYRSIIENMELGLLEVDTNNIIKKAYPRFCELMGYEEHELIGINAEIFLFDQKDHLIMKDQNSKRIHGQPDVYDVRLKRKNSEPIWVTVSGAPIYDLNSNIIGSIGIHQDITDRKAKEDAYKKAKETAEESLRIKQQFLSNVSHEIRTPLNVIIGMSDLLIDSQLNKDNIEDINIIRNSGNHLLQVINDILDLAKIEAGKLQLEEAPIIIRNLIKEQISFQSFNAKNKGLKLHYSIDMDIPEIVYGDDLKLNQILTNIINNAIKFTDKGLIHIEVKNYAESIDIIELHFCITDTGIGIDPKKIDRIFESFTQASNDTSRLYGGTGLGLSIVKSLIELYKGSIWVESEINKGSTFNFTLPFKKHSNNSYAATSNELTKIEVDLNQKSVLIVEDNKLNMLVARRTLENWGCITDSAYNGNEAIDKLKINNYDLVLMDLQMPVLGGLEATRIIRSQQIDQVPIIAMTAYSNEEIKNDCLAAGMNEVIKKPFKKSELRSTLNKYLSRPSEIITEITNPWEFLNNPYLNELTSEDPQLLETLIDIFIQDTPNILNEIEQGIKNKDQLIVRSNLHKYKPSIKIFDFKEISKLIDEIELLKTEFDWELISPMLQEILDRSDSMINKMNQIKNSNL